MTAETRVDVLIIGGGPAGVSCALELHDSRVDYLLLEASQELGGQLASIPHTIKNLAAGFFRDGKQLRERLVGLVEKMRCRYLAAHPVTEAQLSEMRISAGAKTFSAGAVVIATGSRVRTLPIDRHDDFSQHILYRIEGRHSQLKGQNVAVVGGADSACLDALELAEICPQVYLVHRKDRLTARPDIVRAAHAHPRIKLLLNSQVRALLGATHLEGITVVAAAAPSAIELPVTKLVVQIGREPNSEPFRGQLDMDDKGHIKIAVDGSTSCAGVFAAGDVAFPAYPRIATAMGQGMTAAAAARRFIGNM
ncbi:MAG TPA: NAD(P)/FAD-dependent oxidoreductase [Candidatus Obscuribacterales bacterium]